MKKQDIDKLFKTKLREYSTPPPPTVWGNIQANLAPPKSGKKILFLRLASIAAVLAVAVIIAVTLRDSTKIQPNLSENQIIENTEKITTPKIVIEDEVKSNIQSIINEREQLMTASIYKDVTGRGAMPTSIELPVEAIEEVAGKRSLLAQFEFLKAKAAMAIPINKLREDLKTTKEANSNIVILDAEKEIMAMNAMNISKRMYDIARWKVGVQVSPEYSSHSATYSDSYSEDMASMASNGNAKIGVGFSVEYKTNKKWSIESGIYYSQNGQNSGNSGRLFTPDVEYALANNSFNSTAVSVDEGNLLMNSTAGVIQINEAPSEIKLYTNLKGLADKSIALLSSGDYSQVFDFLEVPFYVRYKLVESKFDIQLLGGVSTNFLIGNNVFLEDNGTSQRVGETTNISTINYSGTVGVGVEYALGKHISLSFEPRFNYYLSSINKSPDVDYRPYRIGVYTGLNYTF